MADVLVKGSRITGADRAALGAALAERYRAGESIRALADDIGRSFGFVHGVITEAGVPLRGRGGATRGAAAAAGRRPAAASGPAGKESAGKRTTGKKGGTKKSEGRKSEAKSAGKKPKAGGKKERH